MAEILPELVAAALLQVGSMSAAIAIREVRRALHLGRVTPIPLAPPALRGITLVEDEPVLVVDLRRLNNSSSLKEHLEIPSPRTVGLLCRSGDLSVALTGAQVRTVARLRVSTTSPQPVGLGRWARSAAEWRGTSVPLLSVEEILDAMTSRAHEDMH